MTVAEFIAARMCACGRAEKRSRGMCARCYRHWLDHTPPDQRPIPPRFAVGFWDFVTRSTRAECWLWTGSRDKKGYGRWRKKIASRHSWELTNGPIPDGLWVLHRCDNPPCVNPSHLYLGTVVDNVRDMLARGRHHTPPLKETCNAGHALADGNLEFYVRKDGRSGRRCHTCANARAAEYQQRRRQRLKTEATA